MNAPLYLARSSSIVDGHIFGVYTGYYWSSTVSSPEYARYLGFRSDEIHPESDRPRHYGFSLRCVLRDSRDIVYVSYSRH